MKSVAAMVGPTTWQKIVDLSLEYDDPTMVHLTHYYTLSGFKDAGATRRIIHDRIIQDQHELLQENGITAKAKEQHYNERHVSTMLQQNHGGNTTLGANSPRGGDDWAD